MDTTLSANGQRQTATLNYEISITRETKPRTPPKIILDCKSDRKRLRGLKPCKLYDDGDDDDDDDDDDVNNNNNNNNNNVAHKRTIITRQVLPSKRCKVIRSN